MSFKVLGKVFRLIYLGVLEELTMPERWMLVLLANYANEKFDFEMSAGHKSLALDSKRSPRQVRRLLARLRGLNVGLYMVEAAKGTRPATYRFDIDALAARVDMAVKAIVTQYPAQSVSLSIRLFREKQRNELAPRTAREQAQRLDGQDRRRYEAALERAGGPHF